MPVTETAAAQVAIAAASVATLLGLMALVRAQARAHGFSPELQRKLVHIGTGLYALTLPWLFTDRWPIFMLVGLTLAVMAVLRLPGMARSGLGATLHGVGRKSWGDVLLALAVGAVFLLSDGRPILYVLPIAVLTLADAAAALTGSRYGRGFFRIEEGTKSVEGSIAFFMITLILAMVCLLLLTDVARANVILMALVVAAFGTLVEADSWRGFDNFFLPGGLFLFLEGNLATPPALLVATALAFLIAILVFLAAAPRLGLTAHTARVYVVAIFLLLSSIALENTVLPILVFAAHALARRTNPSSAAHPELDIVASLAMASFAWLVLGLVAGMSALFFYGLTAMGLCLGLAALAVAPMERIAGLGVASATGAGLVALHGALMAQGGGAAMAASGPAAPREVPVGWEGAPLALAVACAVVALAVPLLRPAVFRDYRAGKLTLLALTVPLVAYLWMTGRAKGWV